MPAHPNVDHQWHMDAHAGQPICGLCGASFEDQPQPYKDHILKVLREAREARERGELPYVLMIKP